MGETKEKEGGSAASSSTASKSVPNDKPEGRGSDSNGDESDAKSKAGNEPNAKGDDNEKKNSQDGEPAEKSASGAGVSREQSTGAKTANSNEEAYEKVKKQLRELMAKKTDIDRELEDIEERLYVEEGTYLQDASAGNVAKGFEHYTKGSQNRRKSLLGDQDRVFSQSSTSFEAES